MSLSRKRAGSLFSIQKDNIGEDVSGDAGKEKERLSAEKTFSLDDSHCPRSESTERKANSIDIRPEMQKKQKKKIRRSLKPWKKKSNSERYTSYTQNYTEDGMMPVSHTPVDPNDFAAFRSVKTSKKPVEDAFPGIPLHIIKTNEEREKTLKDLQKQIETARTELEKLYASELAAKQRVAGLQQREQELLKSCEKLEEISVVDNGENKRPKRKFNSIGNSSDGATPNCNLMEVDLRDVQVCELLGTGASGATVYLVNVGGWCCAMKELPRNISNEMDSECFEKEMALLYQIPKHPNIARYLFHKKLRGRYCLFMSRYSGTLRGEIDRRKETKQYLPLRSIIKLSHEVANGLTFLHSQNIIHRDLKSDNVFIAVNRQGDIRDVALGDFDTSKRLGVSTRPKSSVGTPGFMSPEVLNACGKNPYTYSADVFSLGMVLYELMTLEYPYYNIESPIAIASAVINGETPLVLEDQLVTYEPIIELWKQCISVIPANRPSAAEVRDKLVEIRGEIDRDRYRKRASKLQASIKNLNSSETKQTPTEEVFSPVTTVMSKLMDSNDEIPDLSLSIEDESTNSENAIDSEPEGENTKQNAEHLEERTE